MSQVRVDRRTEVVDAAAALFARRGFTSVGMDDIADALAISGPALYWHFAGKDEILAAVLTEASDHFGDALALLADQPVVTVGDVAQLTFDRFLAAPDRSATLVREGHRSTGVAAERRLRMLRKAWHCGRRAVAELPTPLDDDLLSIRLRAILGPSMALSFDPPPLSRSRVHELATTATTALLGAPPRPARAAPEPPAWRPTRSRREQILGAARELFETRGFHAVTVHDIGAALGLRGSSIYRHFASKGELVAAAWEREATRFVAGAIDALRAGTSAPDALARLAASFTQLCLENHALMRMTYFDLENRPEFVGAWPAARRFVADAWCDVLAEERDDLTAAEVRFVVEMALGVVVEASADLRGGSPWADEITHLAVTFATARPRPSGGRRAGS